jgi:hypothetical protein
VIYLQFRTLFIGECLPSLCEKDDIFKMFQSAHDNNNNKVVMLKDVKIPNSDGFSLWKDSTFLTLM